MNPFKLKVLVKTTSKYSNISEFTYMLEGEEGVKIWGKKTFSKNAKLSSLINLIHSDSIS